MKYLVNHDILIVKTRHDIAYRETLRRKAHSTYYVHIHICALRALYGYLSKHQTNLKLDERYADDIMQRIRNEK